MAIARPLVPNTFTGTCPVGLSIGDVVYVSGPSRAVQRVDITDRTRVAAVGVIIRKTGTSCVVQTRGILPAFYGAALLPGGMHFVSTAGRPTGVIPVGSPGTPRWVVVIGKALDSDVLDFNVTTITGTGSP